MTPKEKLLEFLDTIPDMLTPSQTARVRAMRKSESPAKRVGTGEVVVLGGAELREAQETLCRCAQLLQGWHSDGTAWSEWDRDVEKRLHSLQQRLEAQSPQHNIKMTDADLPDVRTPDGRT